MAEKKKIIEKSTMSADEVAEIVRMNYGKKGFVVTFYFNSETDFDRIGEGQPTRCSIDQTWHDDKVPCPHPWTCTACHITNYCGECPYSCKKCGAPRPPGT